ncbi:MAG: hypothetical protein Q8K97_07695 [Pseudohongiella sp.]|nr:hypothetical protein [Pseudohongiella sp.]
MSNVTFNTGLYGMNLASQGLAQSAQQITLAGVRGNDGGADTNAAITGSSNTAEPLVNLKTNLQLFNASAKVVDTADNMLGNLLDVRV